MDFAAELKQRIERGGLKRAAIARLSGFTPQYISQLAEGVIKRIPLETERAVRAALDTLAAGAAGEDLREEHPGATDLAADADLRDAYRVNEEDLAGLRECVVVWRGRPLVLRTRFAAVMLLEAIRRIVERDEGGH